jgi:ribosomal protein S13
MATHIDPATFARSIMIEATDIPADMTIAQWRESRRRSGRRWRKRRTRSAARRLLLPRAAAADAARLLTHDV